MATLTCNPHRNSFRDLTLTNEFNAWYQPLVLPPEADGATLRSLGIFTGTLPSDMRLALYEGPAPASGPETATLVEDLGVLEPTEIGWADVPSVDLPTLAAGTNYWLATKGLRRDVKLSLSGADTGDFDAEGLWESAAADMDQDVAWEAAVPASESGGTTFLAVRLGYVPAFPETMGDRVRRIAVAQDVQANGSTVLARAPELGIGSEVERSLRNDGQVTLRAPVGASWLEHVELGRVIRLTDPVLAADAGEAVLPAVTEEWRVRRVQTADGPDAAEAVVEAAPIIQDLTHVGMIYELTEDGRANFQLGEHELTLLEAWDDFIVPMLLDQGITHWQAEFRDHQPVTVSISSMTPLGLLTQIADAARVDIWAVHNHGSPIRLVSGLRGIQAGAQGPTRRLNLSVDGRRLTRLGLDEDSERLATVAQASRESVGGAGESLGLYGLVLRVVDRDSNDISVADPEEGVDPQRAGFIRFADQLGGADATYPNHYLRKADGSLTEITDTTVSESSTVLTLDDATSISVGDMVEIRRSADDDPPVEAVNPAGLAMSGRSVVPVTGQRGEGRNYVDNPLFFSGLAANQGPATLAQVARVDSYDSVAPSITIKEFQGQSEVIADGSIIEAFGSTIGPGVVDGDHTWVGGTLEIALTANSLGGTDPDRSVIIWRPVEIESWQRYDNTLEPDLDVPVGAKVELSDGDTYTAQVETTVQIDDIALLTGDTHFLALESFDGQVTLQAGDIIDNDVNGERVVVLGRAGEISFDTDFGVAVYPITGSGTWTAGDDVTITRPAWAQGYQGQRLALPVERAGGGVNSPHGWVSAPVRVPIVEGWTLRVFARVAAYNANSAPLTLSPPESLRLALDEGANPGTAVLLVQDPERTYPVDEIEVVEIMGDHTPGSEATYRVRIQAPIDNGAPIFDPRITFVPLEVSVSYGPSAYTLEGVEYSGTNLVYAEMAGRLDALADGRKIDAMVRDVAYEAEDELDVRREKISLGAPWYLNSTKLGLEAYPADIEGAIARVQRYRQSLTDPTDSGVVLDTDLFYLTRDT